jgi:dipeptidyl aminopeptidase/acylaminoacyl peptidase
MRLLVLATCASMLAATLLAATAPEGLEELDQVDITALREGIPLQAFVEFPRHESVAISPDGKRIAMVWMPVSNSYQLTVQELPSMKVLHSRPLPRSQSLADLRWVNDHQIVLLPNWQPRGFRRLREPVGVIVISDTREDKRAHFVSGDYLELTDPLGRIRDEAAALASIPLKGDPDGGNWPGRSAMGPVRMLDSRSGEPDAFLFQTTRTHNQKGNGEGYGVFRLNLQDMKQTRVATMPIPDGNFITGPDDRIALVAGRNAQHQQVVYYLPENVRSGGRDWQLVAGSGGKGRSLRPVAWMGDGEEYYALDDSDGPTRAVVAWNAATNTQRLLYRHASVDMDRTALDPSGKAWMFRGNDHFPVYWYPDPDHPLARLHQALRQKVPNEVIEIVSASDDLSVAVARISSGNRPPMFLLTDVKSAKSIAAMYTYPTLGGRLMRVDPVEFQSRDDLVIHGYLTTPKDQDGNPRKGLPLLVVAHDGPLGEPAGYEYEYERQLFASRGYAVLQVNRRGSPGRGAAFERAGDGKWGHESQQDFADAVRQVVNAGVADPDRVCFYGTGYGAYSAMMAAVLEPGMFRCVIGVSGVYDLPRFLDDGKKAVPAPLVQVLGRDMMEMRNRSPVNLAGSIKARVLLIGQSHDLQFPPEQSSRMHAALQSAGNRPQWLSIGQPYDGQHSPETRARAYESMLEFLDEHIGH